jgi:hypothetical protein
LKEGRHKGHKLKREGRTCPPCSMHGNNDWKEAKSRSEENREYR